MRGEETRILKEQQREQVNAQQTEDRSSCGSLRCSLLITGCAFHYKGFTIYRRPLGIVVCLNYTFFCSRQTALNTLQGYNSKSPRRTGLQRVLVRPKHLYTRPPLSLPCPEPTLHVGGGHVSSAAAPSVTKQRPWTLGRRASADALFAPPPAPDAVSLAGAPRS
jgi:hypothetical protein